MSDVAAQGTHEPRPIVRIDLRIKAASRDRHIRETLVDELLTQARVDVDEDAVGGLALTAVAGHGIAVVEVRVIGRMDRHGTTRIQAYGEGARRFDGFETAEFAVGNAFRPVRQRELHTVALAERAL